MSDQVPHLVMQSDEEMYQKLQELKEKVVSLKESNRIIQSRLYALCGGVGNSEQTLCPECKRQREDEAEVLKELQEKVKILEEQERHNEDEIKKLGESLKTLIINFDKLLEIAQANKISSQSGNNSRQDQRDFATVNSEINGDSGFEKEGISLQDIVQADCVLPIGMNTDNEKNCDDKRGSCSGNRTESIQIKQKLSPISDPKMSSFQGVKTSSESGQEIVTTQIGSTAALSKNQQTAKRNEVLDQSTNQQNVEGLTEVVDHSQHSRPTRNRNCDDEHKQGSCSGNQTESTRIKQKLSTTSDHKKNSFQGVKTSSESGQEENNISPVNDLTGKSIKNDQLADGKKMDNANVRDKICPNTNMGSEPDHPVHRRTTLKGEECQATEVQETVTRQTGSATVLSQYQQTEKRNELVYQSTNQQNVEGLTEVVDHSQYSRPTGDRPVSSVHASRGIDSVTASVSEIYKIQTPGPQLNHEAKVTSSDKDSDRVQKVEITGDIFQEAEGPVKDAKARDTVENICTENSSVKEDLHLTESSIKNPNFQRKPQSYGSKERQQHQHLDEKRKDDHMDIFTASTVMKKQDPEIKNVDLDQHAPIFRVPDTGFWASLAQKELDKARTRKVGEIKTVLCVDTSASMRQGSAWEQTKQFFNQFITGLEEVKKEFDITQEHVAISVFGKEVKVIKRLTNDFSVLRQAFDTLKVGGPSVMYGGLLMALAGVADNTHTATAVGIRILNRIILISDGKPTDPLLASGPDVYNTEEKERNQLAVLEAVMNISGRKIRIHCVPVGDADVTFLETIANISDGKVFSIDDGRKLARKTVNTVNAGFLLNHWKMMNTIHLKILSDIPDVEITLEDAMIAISCNKEMQLLPLYSRIASLTTAEKAEVLEIAKEAIAEDLLTEREDAMEKYHYEFDDPDIKLPPLGTRVRRGPDWDKDFQDEDGPGTILGHHKDQRQVCIEWDRNGNIGFYRYGDMGKYDVVIVDEPRLLDFNDLILTGCHVKRGKDWMYGNLGGTPAAVGVVLKVLEDGRVVVRWPDKSKNFCRFGSDGFFDLEICNPFDDQTGGGMDTVSQSTPMSLGNQSINESESEPSKNKNITNKNRSKEK